MAPGKVKNCSQGRLTHDLLKHKNVIQCHRTKQAEEMLIIRTRKGFEDQLLK
jgi:hypothetical protein